MRTSTRIARVLVLAAAGVGVVACVIAKSTRARELPLRGGETRVRTPVKAHLLDGSVVVFRGGARVTRDSIFGGGRRFSATLDTMPFTGAVPLDSVLGAETFEEVTDQAQTVALSTLATLGTKGIITFSLAGGEVSVLKAIFGSCPTIYTDSAGVPTLQGESFSYSIAPLLEKRDVDRIAAAPDGAGMLRLEVRNEALETHFIDHLEVLEVRHRPDEEAFPAAYGSPVALAALAPPAVARDRAGRDVRALLARADEAVFSTDDATLARAAGSDDVEDWIDVAVPRPAGVDSLAVALRMRSSLLTTVLFYDYMLAKPGARALDWVGTDLGRITSLAKLARWYTGRMGLRVSVRQGGEWRQVARLADFGPIAWRNVAVVVPAGRDDSVRVRLTFVADEWRIDRLALSASPRRVRARAVAAARVTVPGGPDGTLRLERDDARAAIARSDGRRLTTVPGERFFAFYPVGPGRGEAERRTFLVGAQGYYSEWVRGAWMKRATDSIPFDPARVPIRDIVRTWRAQKDSMEAQFFRTKVPVL